ncbi:MAG: TauD/TfdA family dioxygenase, partial [Alphaproteobacteria bacterium]|nr:TauD/TfdA family dioxygenase [Alphaproteobacteria bacterium]
MNSYDTIKVRPLAGAMGAEVIGLDLAQPLGNEQIADIRRAFLDHLMIYFRDQSLAPTAQVALARHFGKPAIYPFLKGLDGVPEVSALIKTETDEVNFGGGWHTDTSYKECPDLGTLLYAVEVPEVGGDTLFANAYLAYEMLSPGMQALAGRLVGINNSDALYPGGRTKALGKLGAMGQTVIDTPTYEAEHPVVRTHPETGRKALYISRAHTLRFKGLTEAESKPLINYLSD